MLQRAWVRFLLLTIAMLTAGYVCAAQAFISVTFAPPALPVYEQPPCPGDDYIWVPGYWAWDADYADYYWVPGTWVLAPEPGYLWTPPYWAWEQGVYVFHAGYWGPQVGFYGGIDYGYGYFGHGYDGGRWERGHFFYNRSVNNVNVTVVHNVYNTRVENRNVKETRVSYNGGNGGVTARPTQQELSASRERHVAVTTAQTQHVQAARTNTQLRASSNRGKPPVAATDKAAQFSGKNVVAARSGGNYTPPPHRGNAGGARAENPHYGGGAPPAANNNANRPGNPPSHARDLPPLQRPTTPNTGNPKQDQKYAQQQQKLYQRQSQERQKLQQQQEQEHQRFQQQANQARQQQQTAQRQQQQQQMEQRHQQQTQQMQQRHAQEQQRMQQRQAPPPSHQNPQPQQQQHPEPHHEPHP